MNSQTFSLTTDRISRAALRRQMAPKQPAKRHSRRRMYLKAAVITIGVVLLAFVALRVYTAKQAGGTASSPTLFSSTVKAGGEYPAPERS